MKNNKRQLPRVGRFVNLVELYDKNKINYKNLIKHSSSFNLVNTDAVDISIIIPAMNRESFHNPVIEHLKRAMANFKDKTYSITIVEHCDITKHKELCKSNQINHIWIKKTDEEPFNKCLCMNVGAIYSNITKYYLFHDIDILMDDNYFRDIFKNIERVNDNSALQTFAGKRVVVMNQQQTDTIINKRGMLNNIVPSYSKPGAPGGSIFIKTLDFINVGGYDAEFFHGYSPEDRFFWDKLDLIANIQGCNNPIIEAYHMNHPTVYGNSDKAMLLNICFSFIEMSVDNKISFIDYISSEFKKNYK
jgi:predicted glycosyltransferase involved in capsule biosynthesis